MSRKKNLLDPIHPGEILLEEFMKPFELSINRLARDLDVAPTRIHGIVNGRRSITADTALRLAQYLPHRRRLLPGGRADAANIARSRRARRAVDRA